ncbi:MAG: ABC transporter ATP-binding protein [Deltaproteobacteria bacterium]|nr:ABC transporter ATP-binding protein [Deltaproteobacteria bacterium]
MANPHSPSPPQDNTSLLQRSTGVFAYTVRAAELVWATSKTLTFVIGGLTLIAGLLPGGIAWTGKQLIDAVVASANGTAPVDPALWWLGLEAGLVITMAAAQRGLSVANSLLRAQLGHRVNVMILDKAQQLELTHFEDSEFYDKLTRARREASSRPLSLVRSTFGLIQNSISLITYGALLLAFSPWAVLVLAIAAVPAFVAETKFAGEAFRLFRWRSPETRKQMYLETVLAREDYAKEVKLFGLGEELVTRYRDIFKTLYGEDRDLTMRRGLWGFLLGLLSTAALYGAYAWVTISAAASRITLGDMTMYLLVFRQGQGAFSAILQAIGGMYEDNLYLSNLYEFLEQEVAAPSGDETTGPAPKDGIRFDHVSFTYPDSTTPALNDVTFHLKPGTRLALVGHNGSGKTTLIKLLTRLYEPSSGTISLDGRPLEEWDPDALRDRVGVIFQDFVRYQFTVGENVGVGDVDRIDDRPPIEVAAERGMAAPFIADLPKDYDTQLGRWFKDGRELSIGQWQKVALSRALMRETADILVLDEPTAAMDAEAEAEIFQRLADLTEEQMAILISHRFSTVRMADHIAVLHKGELVEEGTHEQLMALDGRYAHLFTLQAKGYQ